MTDSGVGSFRFAKWQRACLAVLLVAGLLVVVGPLAGPSASAATAAGRTWVVDAIDDPWGNRFESEDTGTSTVTITAGDTVEWQFDRAGQEHDLTSVNTGTAWPTPIEEYRVPGGPPIEYTFTEPGTYEYICSIHGTVMFGTVVVLPAGSANQPPTVTAGADPTSGAAPLPVHFMATATDPEGDPVSYHWDFGNGDSAEGHHQEYVYPDPGSYTAVLEVSDGRGGVTRREFPITVTDAGAPVVTATAAPSSGPAPLEVAFAATGAGALDYAWDFGDGAEATGREVGHTYVADGTYEATVTATDDEGRKGTDTVTVEVGDTGLPEVEVSASPATGAAPLAVDFSTRVVTGGDFAPFAAGAESYPQLAGSAGLVRSRGRSEAWLEVSGLKPGAAHNVHVHEQACTDEDAGAHFRFDEDEPFAAENEIWLPFTSDAAGDRGRVEVSQPMRAGSRAVSIVIHDPDNPAKRIGCADLVPSTADLVYGWDFGDGTTALGPDPTHTYAAPGRFTATLTVSAGGEEHAHHGGTLTRSVTVEVGDATLPEVEVSASPATGAAPLAVDFSTKVITGGDFAPFAAGAESYPQLAGSAGLVRSRGRSEAWLEVSGLKPGASHNVHVHEQACTDEDAGAHFRFDEDEPFAESNEIWLPFTSDAAGDSGRVEVSQPMRAGSRAVSIVIHDPDNPAKRIGCADLVPSTADLVYGWDFGDGTTALGPDPSHTYVTPGSYRATLTVSAAGDEHTHDGASVTRSVDVIVATADTTAPDTTIVGGPSGVVRSSSATFRLASNERGVTFSCRLDGAAWRACASPVGFTRLRDGSHRLEVRARDAAGNVDPRPAVRLWTVDTKKPVVRPQRPKGAVRDRTPTIRATVRDAHLLPKSRGVQLRIDGRTISSKRVRLSGGRLQWTPRQRLSRGSHVVRITAVDAAGHRTTVKWRFRIK